MSNPKKWLARNKVPLILTPVLIIAGLIAGLAARPFSPFQIEFDPKINAIELIGIISTVLLVWIVTNTLDKRKQTEQNAKALIARRIEEAYELSLKVHAQINEGGVALLFVTSSLKRMNLIVKGAESSLGVCDLAVDGSSQKDVIDQISRLNDLLTNTPVDQQKGEDALIRIENDILIYNASRLAEVNAAFDSLRESITLYQLAINGS